MRIAIAGAGIAGLTTALLLSRAGHGVDLYERAANLSEVGAGVQISPNAGRILEQLGLGPALDHLATRPVAIDIRGAVSGRVIVSLPLAKAAARYGVPYRLMHRGDLQGVLLNAAIADHGIKLHLGAALADFADTPAGMRFSANDAPHEVDLLIGADGVRSKVRELISGPNGRQSSGRTAWRTTIPAAKVPADLPRDRTTMFLGDRTHVVIYPIRSAREINVVAIVEENWTGEGWSEPGDPAWLAVHFRGVSPLLQDTFTAAAGWTRWYLSAVDPLASWQKGHAVLVGDAAHAMLPFLAQGAAMAIEDAAILVRCLTRANTDIEGALARYEVLRKPRVTRVWQTARQSGTIYHMSPLTAPFRDATMKTLGGERLLGRYDWLYGWRQTD
ncbi:FAD-dependent monooxygenase [Kaistia dalseonensis]|uniref:Salicylate hydroxylase n=1 Tax=Kaistia dalseonensis TaxID=410840 RepID=A0ABU0HB71_9HYPH|nr:FAD-dependent monooxygenase [Kaistia dalseonensis]MCX5496938.1 FAD-dependent monooxygenase [Kaistia dalseonensis]MDQ0439563.1 salicylate hydroxylase [Kaistia dalseonensis]